MTLIRRTLFAAAAMLAVALALPGQARAADPDEINRLWQALDMDGVVQVMRAEGLDYGKDINSGLLAGRGGASWSATVSAIYDTERMLTAAHAGFAAALADTDIAPLLTFFQSDLGRRIVQLEISARRALLDPSVTQAAKDRLKAMAGEQDPRLAVLDRFIAANDLVELNVVGGLNASFAFFAALAAESPGDQPTESDILADVWATEADLRKDTGEWVYSFLAMAYQPLTDAEIDRYTALSASPAGQALNRALFAGFDSLFNDLSRDLGRAAGRIAPGEEL